eukprot:scaffold337_cov393-Prasinococcus_capsulatus_cf.AAC.4
MAAHVVQCPTTLVRPFSAGSKGVTCRAAPACTWRTTPTCQQSPSLSATWARGRRWASFAGPAASRRRVLRTNGSNVRMVPRAAQVVCVCPHRGSQAVLYVLTRSLRGVSCNIECAVLGIGSF